jgi:putative ABC transport system permease protein
VTWLTQLVAVVALNIRTTPQRLAASAVAVIGIAGVVIVFVAVLSIAEGFQAALRDAGSPDRAIVMRAGSDTEMTSGLMADHTNIIANAPGLRRSAAGPLASPELFVIVNVPKRSTGTDANVPLRGVTPIAFEVKPEVQIVEGRRFEPGSNEILVGRGALREFAGLDVGTDIRWGEATGRSSGSSRPTARSPKARSGATPGSSSPPTAAGIVFNRCTQRSRAARRSTSSRMR